MAVTIDVPTRSSETPRCEFRSAATTKLAGPALKLTRGGLSPAGAAGKGRAVGSGVLVGRHAEL